MELLKTAISPTLTKCTINQAHKAALEPIYIVMGPIMLYEYANLLMVVLASLE